MAGLGDVNDDALGFAADAPVRPYEPPGEAADATLRLYEAPGTEAAPVSPNEAPLGTEEAARFGEAAPAPAPILDGTDAASEDGSRPASGLGPGASLRYGE